MNVGPLTAGPFRFSPRPNRAHEIRWREWGEAAFAEATAADRPILLGISAVWCHWCHVMDETSYSDAEVIRLANERFVPIRVDNDERPDVNRRYNMGGWPTTAFLMPNGELIHGGTYIPPEQMRSLLDEVADIWSERKDELTARAAELRLKEAAATNAKVAAASGAGPALDRSIVDEIGSLIRGQYDPQFGGFGTEPKFPQPSLLRFLLDEHRRRDPRAEPSGEHDTACAEPAGEHHAHGTARADPGGEDADEREAEASPSAATMIRATLDAMAGGGMYDHVEGGFFRYSTDRQWKVPHFEKMLEDNSELLRVYADAHRLFPDAGYDRVVRDVMRWMDAVLWTPGAPGWGAGLDRGTGPGRGAGVGESGAFAGSQDADEHYFALDAAERAKHDVPFVDRTVYTSWNALAASAYLAAARALGEEEPRERAVAILRTLLGHMRGADGTLFHFDRGPGPVLADLLADRAAFLTALLDAHEDDAMPEALDAAVGLATRLRERLEDQAGGWWDAPAREAPGRLTKREKPIEDCAVAADALRRLAALTGDEVLRRSALLGLAAFAAEYPRWGQFAAGYGAAVARALGEPVSVTVVGRCGDPAADALWRVALEKDDPDVVQQRLDPVRDAEWIAMLGHPAERVAAYVCVGTTCSAPLSAAPALGAELERVRQGSPRVAS